MQPIDITDEKAFQAAGPGIDISNDADFVAEGGAAAAPRAKRFNWLESGVMGAAQGATFGFADEIAGGISAITGGDYRKSRDAARQTFREAAEDNPTASMVGDIAGSVATSFVPGLGIAKGASLAKAALKGGLLSGIHGVGSSEAESVTDQLAEGAASGAVGAGTMGILGKITRGAPERVAKRLIGDVTDGATATQRDRVVGAAGKKAGDVIEAIRANPEIKKAGGDAQKLLPAIEGAIEKVGSQLDEIYSVAGKKTPGVPVDRVIDEVVTIAERLGKDPGKTAAARAVKGVAADIAESWHGKAHASAQELRVLAKDIGDAAFAGSPAVAPKQGKAVSQEVWRSIKGLIDENIAASGERLGKQTAAELNTLNKRMSVLLNMKEAVAYRATRESTGSTRLTERISSGTDVGLALLEPSAFVAKKAFDIVGKPAIRRADEALAALAQMAQAGNTKAQVAQRAVEYGLAPSVGEALNSWIVNTVYTKFGRDVEAQPVP